MGGLRYEGAEARTGCGWGKLVAECTIKNDSEKSEKKTDWGILSGCFGRGEKSWLQTRASNGPLSGREIGMLSLGWGWSVWCTWRIRLWGPGVEVPTQFSGGRKKG